MIGFVGVQARRRKRNRFLFISLVVLILLLIFYIPTLDTSIDENELPNEILPNTVDDQTSLISEIEELKLEVFQKDQRIKFRDKQIRDLRKKNNDLNQTFASLQIEYDKTLGNFSKLENNISSNTSENINEIKKLKNQINDLNKIIKEYEIEINKLKKEVENSISEEALKDFNIENSILKNEIKIIKEKNLEFEKISEDLKSLIKEKQKQIDELLYLKDQVHHG